MFFKQYNYDCGAGQSIFITESGDIYPCQLFYDSKPYKMGSVFPIVNLADFDEVSNSINSLKRLQIKECKQCAVRYSCGSWCKGATQSKGNILSTIEEKCWVQNIILEITLKELVKIQADNNKYLLFTNNFNQLINEYKTLYG